MNIAYAHKFCAEQRSFGTNAASVLDASSQSESLQRKADMVNNATQRAEILRPNNTGMPDNLKAGIESLSGFSMDNVRVHYNSSKPATVQSLAYTQGTDIHVAPGQEKCLPHEAWHVAQQMAGRVSPTTNINGMPVNDNAALEREADVMGEMAVQCKTEKKDNSLMRKNEFSGLSPVQMEREDEFKQNPEKFMRENIVLCDFALGLQKRMSWNPEKSKKFLDYMRAGLFPECFFVLHLLKESVSKPQYILTPAVEKMIKKVSADSTDKAKIVAEYKKDFEELYICSKSDMACSYIEAYYVPYINGTAYNEDHIGCVKVRKNPDKNGDKKWNPDFVFTDRMDGCAFVTTMDGDDDFFSAWHFQSPNQANNRSHSSKFRQNHYVTDWFGDDEYESKNHGSPLFEVTPFLWRTKEGKWKILSQENHFNIMTHDVEEAQGGKILSRELCVNRSSFSIIEKIKSINVKNFIYELNELKIVVDKSQGNLKVLLEMLYDPIRLFVNDLKSVRSDYESVLEQKNKFEEMVAVLLTIKEKNEYLNEELSTRPNNFVVFFNRGKVILDIWVNEIKTICLGNHREMMQYSEVLKSLKKIL